MASMETDDQPKISKDNMPDTVEELNDLISKLTFLKKNFPDEEETQRRQQQFYGNVGGMEVDINSFESIEDAINSAEELKQKKEKEQEENGRETNFDKMLKSKRRIIIKKRESHENKFKPIGAKSVRVLNKRDRKDSKDSNSSSDEELKSYIKKSKKKVGGRRTRGKKRSKSRKKRRKSRLKSRRRKRRRKKRTKRRRRRR
jgi:hypothetical protein